jgi:hypothetical protein
MRSAAAKLRQYGMRSIRQLQPQGNERAVDLNTDIAGKLEHEPRRSRLNIGATANPSSTIGNNAAELGYDHRLAVMEKCR